MSGSEIIIDGSKFNNYLEFVEYMNEVAFSTLKWNGNLDALNDLLRGGFGNTIEGKNIRWINSKTSEEKLGYQETIRWLEERMIKCDPHSTNEQYFTRKLNEASRNIGDTIFDKIIEIITDHCNGNESGDIDKFVME